VALDLLGDADQHERASRTARKSVQAFSRNDLDAEAGESHIGELAAGEQADRGDAEVLEDLRPEPDLAPLPRARLLRRRDARVRDGVRRHAGGAVAEEDDYATAFLLETLQRGVHRVGTTEHVADDVGAVQPRQHTLA